MRKITKVAIAASGVLATIVPAAAANATVVYHAWANPVGVTSCTKTATSGYVHHWYKITNGIHSSRAVQAKVARDGDPFHKPVEYHWIKPGHSFTYELTVPQRTTGSTRVRIPEMGDGGNGDLVLSKTLAAPQSCYVPIFKPAASIGSMFCLPGTHDTVATILTDNRKSTDQAATFNATATVPGGFSQSAVVPVGHGMFQNWNVTIPQGQSAQITVSADGVTDPLLSTTVAAKGC